MSIPQPSGRSGLAIGVSSSPGAASAEPPTAPASATVAIAAATKARGAVRAHRRIPGIALASLPHHRAGRITRCG